MQIAYGTYAMPTVPLEQAIPALAGIGYDGVEICVGPQHIGSLPEEVGVDRRAQLRRLLEKHRLGVPALMVLGSLYTPNEEQHQANLEHMRACAQLARDLGLREPPVLAMGIGGAKDQWETIKGDLVRLLADYAALAEELDFVLAAEAHCGAAVYNSVRAVWLFETVNSPRVRMHFDIVHLFLAGEEIEDAVRTLVPYTAHTHVTDARRHADGTFELVLLGQGELDAVRYVRAMHEAGWNDFITLEVSAMVWSKPGYDPMTAAKWCYEQLSGAFEGAGVVRG